MHAAGPLMRLTAGASTYKAAVAGAAVLAILVALLIKVGHANRTTGDRLVLFCAAGMRTPIEAICAAYEKQTGTRVDVQYGGSNTLLSQLQVGGAADLFLAADDTYVTRAREKGLVNQVVPLARQRLAIAVAAGNPLGVQALADLARPDVRVALGNPDQAAVGMCTRRVLEDAGLWEAVYRHVTADGVFLPTVPDVANSVAIGTVDAAVIWFPNARPYGETIDIVQPPALRTGTGAITIGVTTATRQATLALDFARFAAAADRGGPMLAALGYEPVYDGNATPETPARP